MLRLCWDALYVLRQQRQQSFIRKRLRQLCQPVGLIGQCKFKEVPHISGVCEPFSHLRTPFSKVRLNIMVGFRRHFQTIIVTNIVGNGNAVQDWCPETVPFLPDIQQQSQLNHPDDLPFLSAAYSQSLCRSHCSHQNW